MTILDKIILHKKEEVTARKKITPLEKLKAMPAYNRVPFSLAASLMQPTGTGIIAEFKRKSPSKGFIKQDADVQIITNCYANNGAAALSVLTDEIFFGGTTEDLMLARNVAIPILRKDFIIDAYQIDEAKAMGADVILLIAACLSPGEVAELAKHASALGLEVLLELHDATELNHINDTIKLVGINNRNLKTFEVDIEQSLKMAAQLPGGVIKIAESGISDIGTIKLFREHGFKGFLMGEHFMKQEDTCAAFKNFVNALQP